MYHGTTLFGWAVFLISVEKVDEGNKNQEGKNSRFASVFSFFFKRKPSRVSISFLFCFYICLLVCLCVLCACTCRGQRTNPRELVSSFQLWNSGDQTEAGWLGGKALYPLATLIASLCFFLRVQRILPTDLITHSSSQSSFTTSHKEVKGAGCL